MINIMMDIPFPVVLNRMAVALCRLFLWKRYGSVWKNCSTVNLEINEVHLRDRFWSYWSECGCVRKIMSYSRISIPQAVSVEFREGCA